MNTLTVFTLSMALAANAAWANATPVGVWTTIDDKTQQPRTEVHITETQGVLTGKIVRLLRPEADANAVCDKCTDDRKGARMVGLEIIRHAKPNRDASVWEGGEILDAENGKAYKLRLTPIDGGAKLEVRGSIGPFGRTQTWIRVE